MKKFFCSPKLTFILLIILAALAIIGTIIPQNEQHYLYIEKYGYNLYLLFKILSITDVYHSWWFVGLLGFLSLNIITCALNRFKPGRQILTNPRQLGYFATHLSFLIILSGGLIGSLWGFKDYLYLKEGEVQQVPQTNFYIKLNKFWLEYYPDSKMIKDYKSNLSIIENGKEILTKTIEVNYPLNYKGIRFYQASYKVDVDKDFHHFYYSGLQVVKDPGVGVVWLGCSLLMLGLTISCTSFRS
ncbi:MAG: cytochrome c biogenesis protein ResB [Nitrospirota bacterium]